MQDNRELMELNEYLTDAEITWAIRYLHPDLCAERTGEDAGTLVGICITLLTGLTGAITLHLSLHAEPLNAQTWRWRFQEGLEKLLMHHDQDQSRHQKRRDKDGNLLHRAGRTLTE
jgi:hypothetical protein